MRGIGELLRAGIAAIAGRPETRLGLVSDNTDYPSELGGEGGVNGNSYVVIRKAPRELPAEREANYWPLLDEVFDPNINKDI